MSFFLYVCGIVYIYNGLEVTELISMFTVYDCREEEAIKLDGMSVAQLKEMRDTAEKHTFQAEVDRMMKLIINSLYKNKEVTLWTV